MPKTIVDKLQMNCNNHISKMNSEEVSWVPLLYFENLNMKLGILLDGRWVVEGKNCLFILDEPKLYVRVMALLEIPINIVHKKIADTINVPDLEIQILEIFPFVEIVKAGLEQKSEYWAEIALEWFGYLPFNKKKLLIESLDKITTAPWASQKLRHRTKKEIDKINKENLA